MCQSLYSDLEVEITGKFKLDKNHSILATFYEAFGKTRESLDIW